MQGWFSLVDIADGQRKATNYIPFGDTIRYLQGVYGINGVSKIDPAKADRRKFSNCHCGTEKEQKPYICTREQYLRHFKTPSNYFIERGFSPEVLQRYDVRHYTGNDYVYFNRSCIPVYDETNRYLRGFTSRSECNQNPKWLYSPQFPSSTSLFNLFNAKDRIVKTKTVILVEGPLDCLRLVEAGISECVALWGLNFNDYKRYLLDKLGVMRLVLALDNDKAGHEAAQTIEEANRRLYNMVRVQLPDDIKDIAKMSIEQVKQLFGSIL